MLGIFLKLIKKYLIRILKTENIRKEIIDAINKHVDIPMITEDEEEKVYIAIFDVFESVLMNI